mgnify:CR=1 FL=1
MREWCDPYQRYMGETELACSAFGQGYTLTMIQEINAMCSVINGGYYYQPHLVTKIKDSSGGIVKTISTDTDEADDFREDICRHPFLHGSQRRPWYQPYLQGAGLQLRW